MIKNLKKLIRGKIQESNNKQEIIKSTKNIRPVSSRFTAWSIGKVRKVNICDRKPCILFIDRPSVNGIRIVDALERYSVLSYISISDHRYHYVNGNKKISLEHVGINFRVAETKNKITMLDIESWFKQFQKDCTQYIQDLSETKVFDLILIYATSNEIGPKIFKAISDKFEAPICLLCLDERHTYWKDQIKMIGLYDLHLTNSKSTIPWYEGANQPVYYFPEAIDENYYFPMNLPKDYDVSFIGLCTPPRRKLIRKLQKLGVMVECFGRGWDNGPVKDHREIFWKSKIVLGFGSSGPSEKFQCIKGRDFEVPACGALYMTTFNYELAEELIHGKHLFFYNNEYDCAEQINYLLNNEEPLVKIQKQGCREVLRKHKWSNRFDLLLSDLSIEALNEVL